MGEKPALHHYPYLVELVEDNRFEIPAYTKPMERVYLYALGQLVNYILAQAGEKPRKNYVKRKVDFDLKEITSKAVSQLRHCLKQYYEEQKDHFETELVTVPKGCASSAAVFYELPKSVSLEQITYVIIKTQKTLTPSCSITYDQVFKNLQWHGDVRHIPEYTIKDEKDMGVVEVCYHHYDQNKFRMGFSRVPWDYEYHKGMNVAKHLQNIEVFLQYLDKAFEHSKSSN